MPRDLLAEKKAPRDLMAGRPPRDLLAGRNMSAPKQTQPPRAGFKEFAMGGAPGFGLMPGSEEVLPSVGQSAGQMFGPAASVGGAAVGIGARDVIKGAREGNFKPAMQFGANPGLGFADPKRMAETGVTAATEGLFRVGGKALKPLAGRLMNSVLKPNIRQITGGKNLGLEAAEAGISGTKKQIFGKASKMVKEGEDKLQKILSGSTGKVNLPKALSALDDLEASYTRIGNKAGLAEIQNLREAIKGNLSFGSYGDVPVSEANVLKRDLYKILKESSYGTGEVSPAVAVRKAAARGLKEGIEQAEPGVKDINKQIGLGGRVRDAIEKRLGQEQKNVMLPFFEVGGAGASLAMGHPGIAALIGLRRLAGTTPVKSTAAKALIGLSKQKELGQLARLGFSEGGRRVFGN